MGLQNNSSPHIEQSKVTGTNKNLLKNQYPATNDDEIYHDNQPDWKKTNRAEILKTM